MSEYPGVFAGYLKATTVNASLALLDRYGIGCVFTTQDSQLAYSVATCARLPYAV
jgi:hypothetical protein